MAYAFARSYDVELFNASQSTLTREFGAINTIVLITSSFFVVRAVAAIKNNNSKICVNWLGAALFMGLIFLVIKIIEFYGKFSEGINLSTNTFYMFYLSLTFFHFMHVILGMVILTAILFKTRQGAYSANNHIGVETGASYWHMVDLVWIVLFPLIYIIR
jgi:nitric oxide reductase NorE protein